MSDEEKKAERIVDLIDDEDGFTVLLHVNRVFDQEKYDALRSAIVDYAETIENSVYINRKVAGRLFFLEQFLENVAAGISASKRYSELAQTVTRAHAEIWELVDDILSWPDET
ncbi:MAG: hypothetical protein L0154_16915 [Chloroflexi bacterium]|nr:hypothetical protein [Chloroflexota bacterium]